MKTLDTKIINKLGLHARAAAKFVKLAGRFEAEIMVRRGEREVNGKSILGVMTLAASRGTKISISADGPDEELALRELDTLINARFDEGE